MFIFTLISIINFMASNHMAKIRIENMENMVKIECLFPSFTFAGFADLLAAKEGQFADCRQQRKLPAKRHV